MIQGEAEQRSALFLHERQEEILPIVKSMNRISKYTHTSPQSTPQFDTSAMDGYALNSAATVNASAESPVRFRVKGTIAAGDEPVSVSGDPENGIYPCVEIMTGARFPFCERGEPFDCCVRVEDTEPVPDGSHSPRYVQLTKEATKQQNRRLAGNDFQAGDVIISAGTVVKPNHIMSLASVGVREIAVLGRPRIAILSTGSELMAQDAHTPRCHRIQDVNGPYLTATLESWGAEVDFLGAIDDGAEAISRTVAEYLNGHECDLIISTGAVSAGRFDMVRPGIEEIGARVIFHKLAMRPGHPALFAMIPSGRRAETAFFGLPGNPVASAACLEFLVRPFLRKLQLQTTEPSCKATVRGERNTASDHKDAIATFPPDTDVFRLAIYHSAPQHHAEVSIIADHSPGKVKPFLAANCWAHIPAGKSVVKEGDVVDVIPLRRGRLDQFQE